MKENTSKIILAAVISLLMPQLGHASDITPELRAVNKQSDYVPHVGLSLGVGAPEGSLNAGENYALEIGFQPYIPFGTAMELSRAEYSAANQKLNRTSLLLKGAYNFGGTIPIVRHSYVGLGLGPVWEERRRGTNVALGFLPNLGFDYPLKDVFSNTPLSVGVNASYLLTSSGEPSVFAMNGVLKYWY